MTTSDYLESLVRRAKTKRKSLNYKKALTKAVRRGKERERHNTNTQKIIAAKRRATRAKNELIYHLNLIQYRKTHGDYYKHPEFSEVTILVPIEVRYLPSKDRVNTLTIHPKDIMEGKWLSTLLGGIIEEEYTPEQYIKKYCYEYQNQYYFQ